MGNIMGNAFCPDEDCSMFPTTLPLPLSPCNLQRVPSKSLPKGCQVDHIELYNLQGRRPEVLAA